MVNLSILLIFNIVCFVKIINEKNVLSMSLGGKNNERMIHIDKKVIIYRNVIILFSPFRI